MNTRDKPSFWDTEYFLVDPQTGKWLLRKDAPAAMHREFKAFIQDVAQNLESNKKDQA